MNAFVVGSGPDLSGLNELANTVCRDFKEGQILIEVIDFLTEAA